MAATKQSDDTGPLDTSDEDVELDLYEFLSGFGTTGAIKVRLKRISPTAYKGVKTNGNLPVYEEPVGIERIDQDHGGGKYQMTVETKKKDKHGKPRWGYAGSRTFDIAGVPKIEGLIPHEVDDYDSKGNGTSDGPVSQAMNMVQQAAKDAREEARELRNQNTQRGGFDTDLLNTMLAPLRDQVSLLSERLAEKDKMLLETLNKPVDNTSTDRLFGIMENKEAAHGNNLEAVRQQYESRIAKLQDFHLEELKRYEDRMERELTYARQAHQREIDSLKFAHQQAMDSQRHGFEMRIDGMKDITKRLEREVNKAETETVELRTKKEQGPLDQIQNLVTLKQGMEALVPTGGEEKSGWERALDMVANSPVAEAVVNRLAAGAQPGAASEEEEQQMMTVRLKDGRVVQMPAHIVQRMQEQEAAAQAENEARKAAGEPEIPQVSDADMAKAVAFMESAIRNGTDPAIFAASARNMLPDDILQGLRRLSIDDFMAKMAKIQTGSPLATVAGRTWARQVAEFLITGEVSEEPEPSEEEEAVPDDIPDDLG